MSFEDLGPNSGLVEDLYERYRQDPESIPERWRKYFTEHPPDGNGNGAPPSPAPASEAPAAEAPVSAVPPEPQPSPA